MIVSLLIFSAGFFFLPYINVEKCKLKYLCSIQSLNINSKKNEI